MRFFVLTATYELHASRKSHLRHYTLMLYIESERITEKHGQNNYKDTKPLRSSFLKKLTCKGIWRQVFICLRPLPSFTHCIQTGKGGGGVGGQPVRRLESRWFTRGAKNTNMTDCFSSL